MTRICASKLTIIASDNGLSPGRRQAIIWSNDGILLIWPLGTNFSGILIEIDSFSFNKIHMKMSSAKWRPFCLGLNVLNLVPETRRRLHLGYDDILDGTMVLIPLEYTLTHWGRDKMDAIYQTTFPSAFSRTKMFEFRLKFHWSLFLRV